MKKHGGTGKSSTKHKPKRKGTEILSVCPAEVWGKRREKEPYWGEEGVGGKSCEKNQKVMGERKRKMCKPKGKRRENKRRRPHARHANPKKKKVNRAD